MHDEHPQRQFDESKDEPPPWWRTSPTDLAGVLAEIVAETADEHQPEIDLFWILFEYYNYLIDLREPLFAAACGEAVVDFFRDSDNKRFEAMFLELVARTRLEAGELAVGLAAFERMAEIHVPDGQEAEVSALAQDVWSYAGSGRFSMDVQPVLLASVSRVFRKLGESGPLAQVFLEAAELYSASGASAAAERAMEDAFSVTRDAQLEEFEAILSSGKARHVINVDAIQRDFPSLDYRIVALNACHAGAAIARNYQQTFRTHDAAGYPALLLLNRKSVVCAPSWTLDDVASYLQTVLMAIGVVEGLSPSLAFSRAIAQLWDLTQAEAIALLARASQTPPVQAEIANLSAGHGSIQKFAHPFYCGGQTVYGLL